MMWNRAELKMRGNMAFKKNYVSAVVVALLMGIFGTASGESSARRVSENSDIYSGNLFNVGMITGLLAGITTVVILIVLVAKVFVGNLLKMGDTGSLALGGAVAVTGALSGNILYIPVIGITYVASSISVILQVAYFKRTKGKRLFLMAPLHHHFQHKGYSESKIAFGYKFVTMIAGIAVIVFNIAR